jgi:hypothetical protein
VATIHDLRAIALDPPRAYEAVVHGRVKFRVGQIVFAAVSRDESQFGFAFPKLERDALVASDPTKFALPSQSDMRFNWVTGNFAAIDERELLELIVDGWTMCVPKFLSAAYIATHPILAAAAIDEV